jgi:hypothetical protein
LVPFPREEELAFLQEEAEEESLSLALPEAQVESFRQEAQAGSFQQLEAVEFFRQVEAVEFFLQVVVFFQLQEVSCQQQVLQHPWHRLLSQEKQQFSYLQVWLPWGLAVSQ